MRMAFLRGRHECPRTGWFQIGFPLKRQKNGLGLKNWAEVQELRKQKESKTLARQKQTKASWVLHILREVMLARLGFFVQYSPTATCNGCTRKTVSNELSGPPFLGFGTLPSVKPNYW